MTRTKSTATLAAVVISLLGIWNVTCNSGETPTYPLYDFDKVAHSQNVEMLGYVDSEPSLKMDIQEINGKWYLYVAHYWPPHGWTVIDVTDPRKPTIAKRIPLWTTPETTDTTQIAVGDGLMLTSLELYTAGGANPKDPFDEGVMIFDVKTDPANPKFLSQWKTGSTGVHRVTYFGGKYAHIAARRQGCNGSIYVILDISDPANPKEAGSWHVPGQCDGDPAGAKAPEGTRLHGAMADSETNISYLSYQGAGVILLDISNAAAPEFLGQLRFSPPFKSGIHSAYPLPGTYDLFPFKGRKLAFVNGEAIAEGCNEPLVPTGIVDITDPAKPTLVQTYPAPVPPPGAPYRDFCEKWGRCGIHNTNDLFGNPFVQHSHNLLYVTWFNAGLRVLDISDPRLPVEVGYYIPPNPTKKLSPVLPKTALVVQSQYALVDTRGYIYMSDWNEGIWVLRYTGPKSDNP